MLDAVFLQVRESQDAARQYRPQFCFLEFPALKPAFGYLIIQCALGVPKHRVGLIELRTISFLFRNSITLKLHHMPVILQLAFKPHEPMHEVITSFLIGKVELAEETFLMGVLVLEIDESLLGYPLDDMVVSQQVGNHVVAVAGFGILGAHCYVQFINNLGFMYFRLNKCIKWGFINRFAYDIYGQFKYQACLEGASCCLFRHLIIITIMLTATKGPLYRFSSSAIAAKTYAKFQEKYAANLAAFNKKNTSSERLSDTIKRTNQKAYQHPYDDHHQRPYSSSLNAMQTHLDLLGAEQVSPHYENFGMARQEALIFWGGYLLMKFVSATPDFHFFAEASSSAWLFTFGYLYIWTEGKKSFAMPILNRFYRKITAMEMANIDIYYAENVEARVRNLMNVAKQQIDFKSLHTQYLSIRNNTLLSFLISEQVLLKNHLHERATAILKTAESVEAMNHSKIISGVMAETLGSIDKAYANNKEQIERDMFELALEGIANGRMDYAKDPILPYVVRTIQQIADKFGKISEADQKKLVKLTAEQLTAIKSADERARDEFLANEPKIDGSLKNNEIVGKILERWGK